MAVWVRRSKLSATSEARAGSCTLRATPWEGRWRRTLRPAWPLYTTSTLPGFTPSVAQGKESCHVVLLSLGTRAAGCRHLVCIGLDEKRKTKSTNRCTCSNKRTQSRTWNNYTRTRTPDRTPPHRPPSNYSPPRQSMSGHS